MHIFYSWQTDSPRKTNKDFILLALNDAVDSLQAGLDIDPAARDDSNSIEIDHDTKDILGAPPVAQVIFDKIKAANIILLDVSLVAKGQRKHINSNVAIECGYALGTGDYTRILNVMNTASGDPSNLPFDLPDRRHPVTYRLDPNADQKQISAERKKLSKKLREILSLYLQKGSTSAANTAQIPHLAIGSTYCESAYWNRGEPLVDHEMQTKTFRCESDKLVAVRIVPEHLQSKLTRADCDALIRKSAPMINMGGISFRTNRWGALAFATEHSSNHIVSGTQLFREREVWCFTEELIYSPRDNDDDRYDWLTGDYRLMKYLPDGISTAVALSKLAGVTTFKGSIIAANLERVFVTPVDYAQGAPQPLFDSAISIEFGSNSELDSQGLAYEFTKKIYGEAGIQLRS